MTEYKLTVIIPSYNKAKYIKEALNSVFMQKTTYPYQIIIADDCSNDNTLNIIKEYQKQYTNLIVLPSAKNQGLYKNIIRAYKITKTDYFCVLDPDDFWIDKYKIQKSLDFLENNKEFTIYVTNTLIQNKNGIRKVFINNTPKDCIFDDYLKDRATLGCTLGGIFRNVIFKNGLPEKMVNLQNESCERSFRGDSFRNIIHLQQGKAHSVDDFDGVYRITDDSLWQSLSEFKQDLLNAEFRINSFNYFDEQYIELLVSGYIMLARLRASKSYLEEIDDLVLIRQYLSLIHI